VSRPADIYANARWAVNRDYPGRAHLVLANPHTALCRMPVHELHIVRPLVPLICPECALAFVATLFAPGLEPPPSPHPRRPDDQGGPESGGPT
jgi:hypothetical protein